MPLTVAVCIDIRGDRRRLFVRRFFDRTRRSRQLTRKVDGLALKVLDGQKKLR